MKKLKVKQSKKVDLDRPFVRSSAPIEAHPLKSFDFGEALEFLKQGKKVARKGWNGKGQFVYYVPADRYLAKTEAAKSIANEYGMVNYRAYLALKTAQGDVATWVPSISDCLAEDWEVVE